MRRLAYSPRAFIFIRSSTEAGRIYDVSSDIVRGSVTQNLGDVCSAEFILRNRYKKYLRNASTQKSIFLPMDLVTIWLQRLPGNPIQQFTGFLDAVPYYQGYPGDAPFSATCSLKKLAYTWFDPGLSFFQNWLVSNGWGFDPTTGQAFNTALNWDTQKLTDDQPLGAKLNDGSFGKLLGNFMVDVAGWNTSDVLISDLPPQLPKAAKKLYNTIATDATKTLNQLSDFFGAAMGVSVDLSTKTDNATLMLQDQMASAAHEANVPLIILAWAAQVMTHMQPGYNHGPDEADRYGYGLYALRPPIATGAAPGTALPPGAQSLLPDGITTIDGRTIQDILDPGTSTQVMATRLIKQAGSTDALAAHQSDLTALSDWLQAAVGRPLPKTDAAAAYKVAKQFANASVVTLPTVVVMPAIDPGSFTWDDLQRNNIMTEREQAIIRTYYKSKSSWLAALVFRLKHINNNLRLSPPPFGVGLSKDQVLINGPDDALASTFKGLAKDKTIDHITLYGGSTDVWWDSEVASANSGHISIGDTSNPKIKISDGMVLEQKSAPAATAATYAPAKGRTDDATQGDPTVSWERMANFTATTGFAANFSFPTDIIASNLLTGQKALMNDMSCLTAVKQFAGASMRTFRSLPDGRFLAFYPDYFGANRDPYWSVENIELVNFGIVLNDEQLATHVFVSGDTINFDNQVDLIEQLGTTGVATITQSSMLQSFMQPWDPNADESELGRLFNAHSFLEHYGARPYKEDQPIIRNAAFEFLYAWQRFMQKWSQLFSTTVEMTFQPEIMAGGLIKFPDHYVQMFVESVTHSFDYEAGFNTTAVLSAPSIPKGTPRSDARRLPGFALAGAANTVGIAGG